MADALGACSNGLPPPTALASLPPSMAPRPQDLHGCCELLGSQACLGSSTEGSLLPPAMTPQYLHCPGITLLLGGHHASVYS